MYPGGTGVLLRCSKAAPPRERTGGGLLSVAVVACLSTGSFLRSTGAKSKPQFLSNPRWNLILARALEVLKRCSQVVCADCRRRNAASHVKHSSLKAFKRATEEHPTESCSRKPNRKPTTQEERGVFCPALRCNVVRVPAVKRNTQPKTE